MSTRAVALALSLAAAAIAPPAAGRPAAVPETSGTPRVALIGRLSWLAGCWESAPGERQVEEHWMRPLGGSMLGMSRTVTAGRTSEFEYMQIREQEGRLVFTAHPSGQAEASFRSREITDSAVVFENLAHDFPQRIMYRRQADGSLLARIEGERDGKARGVDFPMRPAPCDRQASGGQRLFVVPERNLIAVYTGWNIYDGPGMDPITALGRVLEAVRVPLQK